MEKQMDLNKKSFIPVHTNIENVELDGEKVIRVVKAEKIMEFDENTYAKLKDFSFHNGTIEVDVYKRQVYCFCVFFNSCG